MAISCRRWGTFIDLKHSFSIMDGFSAEIILLKRIDVLYWRLTGAGITPSPMWRWTSISRLRFVWLWCHNFSNLGSSATRRKDSAAQWDEESIARGWIGKYYMHDLRDKRPCRNYSLFVSMMSWWIHRMRNIWQRLHLIGWKAQHCIKTSSTLSFSCLMQSVSYLSRIIPHSRTPLDLSALWTSQMFFSSFITDNFHHHPSPLFIIP